MSRAANFSCIVEHMEDAGLGALKRQFEELAAKLAAEGLFAPSASARCPRCRSASASITSPTGAAVRDILHVLARRFPAVARADLSGGRAGRAGGRGDRRGAPARRYARANAMC